MSAEDTDKATLLLRDVPGDVVRELDARAETNYRSRSGEVLAILTAVCRGHVALPVSMDGATVAALKAADDLEPDPDLSGLVDEADKAPEAAGGEA